MMPFLQISFLQIYLRCRLSCHQLLPNQLVLLLCHPLLPWYLLLQLHPLMLYGERLHHMTKDPFIIITTITAERRRVFQITLARATVPMLYNANQRVPYIAVIETNTSTRKEMRLLLSAAESAQIALRQDK
ncbi:PREDICTED: uncharacterized protein LOC107356077 [Acropora digitifera]|uniref:uncharacterized protein LOC107356077 n=1 Tax=Acropora digitifera TaxID=70779 RepID=UPI00077A6EE1|nr:PREDICTED: uncharacterized protein LOC107356077 [Acropora digitifera]